MAIQPFTAKALRRYSVEQRLKDKDIHFSEFPKTIKEALTNTGADHPEMNGSLLDGGASFMITMPSFVANFKRNESIIIFGNCE
ncbi:MAG: hypothetical protein K6A23_13890 [Butyrivibrio sp.]|nr:hypothetical protein [Butyrivibrio sp.]